MIRAVLDANAVASGVLGAERETSTPGAVWRAWRAKGFELVTSEALMVEVDRTLGNPYFAPRVSADRREETIALLVKDATLVPVTEPVTGVATHPEDDLVLASAVSAGVDYLVTGDKQLLRLGSFRRVAIVTPREFLDILERQAKNDAETEDTDRDDAESDGDETEVPDADGTDANG